MVPVAPSASQGKTLPSITTRASAVVRTTAGSNVGGPHHQAGGEEDRADHDRRDDQGAALAEADQRDQAGDQRTGARAGHGQPEELPVGGDMKPATAA